jgi:UDP-N-acetylglucosamine 3-dehydrogenase
LLTKVQAAGGSGPGVIVPASPTMASPYALELKHFFACIEGKETPIVTARDARAALELAFAAIESAASGKPITLASRGE